VKKIIFVYNADSGLVNSWLDMAHKVVSPATYECDLCALTHGNFTEKSVWKDFRNSNIVNMEFYHKDEFLSKYKSKWLPKYTFPIILYSDGERLEPFITATIFKEIETVEDLIEKIKTFLNTDEPV
jgi:hypothetical protein